MSEDDTLYQAGRASQPPARQMEADVMLPAKRMQTLPFFGLFFFNGQTSHFDLKSSILGRDKEGRPAVWLGVVFRSLWGHKL